MQILVPAPTILSGDGVVVSTRKAKTVIRYKSLKIVYSIPKKSQSTRKPDGPSTILIIKTEEELIKHVNSLPRKDISMCLNRSKPLWIKRVKN